MSGAPWTPDIDTEGSRWEKKTVGKFAGTCVQACVGAGGKKGEERKRKDKGRFLKFISKHSLIDGSYLFPPFSR